MFPAHRQHLREIASAANSKAFSESKKFMLQTYQQHGVSFRYQSDWELTEESTDAQHVITLQTAGASFWTITIFEDRPDPELILESVLDAFHDDYEDVDVYPVQATLHRQPAAAADLDFVYLDVITSVVIRAFQTDAVSALVMYQGTDQELEHLRSKFDAVTESLEMEGRDEE